MARTALTKTVAPGSYPTAGVTVTWNTGDATLYNDFVFTAAELVLARNDHATDPQNVTIESIADEMGRTGNVVQAIAAGKTYCFGPFRNKTGWLQSGGKFHITPATTDIKLAVITLPGV